MSAPTGGKSVNEMLQSRSISHQVDLQQLTQGTVRKIIALLNRTDVDLVAQLRGAMDRDPPSTTFTVERLDAMLMGARAVNKRAYEAVGQQFDAELRDLASYEVGFHTELIKSVLPGSVPFAAASVTAEQAYTAAMSRPFQGRLLREWMSDLESTRATRIRDSIRMGYLEGQTNDEIIKRIRGTRAAQYQDGILQIDRRSAEAVVRTAVAHVAGSVRDDVFASNADLIKEEMWNSTLDTRTSEGCQIRDNKRYETGTHKPIGHAIPWKGGPGRLHWRCRSASVPITKSWRELGLNADEVDEGTRSSMDGQVPADMSYGDWLKNQSEARQNQVLGPTRAQLMREGKLPFDAFYTNRGEMLTLDELRARDAKAFKKAGLD